MWGACLYAIWRGGWEERLTAIGIIAATYLTVLVRSPRAVRYDHPDLAVAAVDLILFFILVCIALKSRKFWPIWLSAMHGLTLFSHFAPFVPHVIPWAYYNATVLWAYPMTILLGFATYRHHHKQPENQVTLRNEEPWYKPVDFY